MALKRHVEKDPFEGVMTREENLEDEAIVDEEVEDDYDPLDDPDAEMELVDSLEEEEEAPVPVAAPTDPAVLSILETLANNQAAINAPRRKERQTVAPVDLVALKKEFNEKLHETDDPAALVEKYAASLLGPQMASQNLELQKLKKDTLKVNPQYKVVLEDYADEVEDVIASLPVGQQSHPDAYKYAADKVLTNRFVEIAGKINNDGTIKPRKPASTRPGKTRMVGGQGAGQTASTRKRNVKYTNADLNGAKRYGMKVQDYVKMVRG